MPNPKDYMDDKHVYVKGHVRRKHIEPDLSPEDLENLAKYETRKLIISIAIWVVHIISTIVAFVLPIKVKLPDDWGLFSVLVGGCLCLLLLVRIERWWQYR